MTVPQGATETAPTPPDPPVVTIEGDLVALGPLRRDLLPVLQRWMNDLVAGRNLLPVPRPMSLEAEAQWLDRALTADPDVNLLIYERETWRPVGSTSLNGVDFRNGTAEFGLLIGEPDARGKGYGTETARLVLDYAFTVLGLQNVMLRVWAYNRAAIRAYEKAGCREFGRRRQSRPMAGKRWDEVHMDCLAEEFESPVLARLLAPANPDSR